MNKQSVLKPFNVKIDSEDKREYSYYVDDAVDYWDENGYWGSPISRVTKYTDGNNEGVTFGRMEGTKYHLSRFAVMLKGQGLGSKIVEDLQQQYNHITLWSNTSAIPLYTKFGFKFTDRVELVDGEEYRYGEWEKQ